MADTETTEAPTQEYIDKLGALSDAITAAANTSDELEQDDFAFALRTLALKVTKAQRAAITLKKRADGEAVRGAKPKANGGK